MVTVPLAGIVLQQSTRTIIARGLVEDSQTSKGKADRPPEVRPSRHTIRGRLGWSVYHTGGPCGWRSVHAVTFVQSRPRVQHSRSQDLRERYQRGRWNKVSTHLHRD